MNRSFIESFQQRVAATWPIDRWRNLRSIVAVSGGPDSVALLHALVQLRDANDTGELIVAHVNHGTRGEDSNRDAQFVAELAKHHQLPLAAFDPPSLAATKKATKASEDSLRSYRYDCLRRAAEEHGARYLVTGHTFDDQVETVLFRVLRGTGLRGLAGIPTTRVLQDGLTLVRPMLAIRRAETEQLLRELNVEFRVDPSNETSNYTRNFLRNDVLPQLRGRFPDVDQAIANLTQHAAAFHDTMPTVMQSAADAISVIDPQHVRIDCNRLAAFPTAVICETLIDTWDRLNWARGDINQATWNQLAELISATDSNAKVLNLPGDVRAERTSHVLNLKNASTK